MSRYTPQRLYELLPAVYRQRDAELGFPLRDLVADLAEQAMVVEADIARLYESWFIETCDPWVVPYIGDLIGVRGAPPAGLEQRAEVANTLAYRRRKGTLAALEQLARDVFGRPARAVEFFELLEATQFLSHLRPHCLRTPDLRQVERLEHLGGPFESAAHTVDVRRMIRGRYNISNLGIYLWRLTAYPFLRSSWVTPRSVGLPLVSSPYRYTFNPAGLDAPLFTDPVTEAERFELAAEINVPAPIRRRALNSTPDLYYGPEQSIEVRAWGLPGVLPADEPTVLPVAAIVAGDLSDWNRAVPAGRVAIDPVLGRLAFASGLNPTAVEVRYAYGFSDGLGGGPYERQASFTQIAGEATITVGRDGDEPTLADALTDWTGGSAVILIQDSRTYDDPLPHVAIPEGVRLEVRAANGQRPCLLLQAPWEIAGGGKRSRFEINGLLVQGDRLRVTGDLAELRLRHCTLVPPVLTPQPALEVDSGTSLVLESTITGPVWTGPKAVFAASDSILDGRPADVFTGLAGTGPGGAFGAVRCTVLSGVHCREVTLAENSIFLAAARAARRQTGCVRFCWVHPDSRLPRRFHCQPATRCGPAPRFTSLRYGDPGYCQLTADNPDTVRRLADDEGEPGAFASLHLVQREDYLRSRLAESLRAGLEIGIFFVT
jgi:hypothetical protein